MDAEHCEFIAGDNLVQMKPRFNESVVSLLAGDVGPFEAGIPLSVPLWLAIDLRRRHKCEIIPPEWLRVDNLKTFIVAEGESAGLSPLPDVFFETAHLLVKHAKEDLVDGDQVKTLVQDIWDKREAKLRTSILLFLNQAEESHARVDHVQRLELAAMREPVLKACEETDRLVANYHRAAGDAMDGLHSSSIS